MKKLLCALFLAGASTSALAGGGPYYVIYDKVCNVDALYYGTDNIVFGTNIAQNCTPAYTVTVGSTVMYSGTAVVYSGYIDLNAGRVVFSDATSVPGKMYIVELNLSTYTYTEYLTDGSQLSVSGMGTWMLSAQPPIQKSGQRGESLQLPPRGGMLPFGN